MKKLLSLLLALLICITLSSSGSTYAATTKYIVSADVEYTIVPGEKLPLYVKTTKKVTWNSSDKSIAVISKKGVVTAKEEGTVTITAKIGSKKYKCTVVVYDEAAHIQKLRDSMEDEFRNKQPMSSLADVEFIDPTPTPDAEEVYNEPLVEKEYNKFLKEWMHADYLYRKYKILADRGNGTITFMSFKTGSREDVLTIEDVPSDLNDGKVHTSNGIRYQYFTDFVYGNQSLYAAGLYFNISDLKQNNIIK